MSKRRPKYQKPLHDQLDHYLDPPNNLIWLDKEGTPHFDIPGLLRLVDLPDSPENRQHVTDLVKDLVRQASPEAMIIERDKPD